MSTGNAEGEVRSCRTSPSALLTFWLSRGVGPPETEALTKATSTRMPQRASSNDPTGSGLLFEQGSKDEIISRWLEPEKICRAARHGCARARQRLDVKELVREYQLLREHIFLYLREHAAQPAGLATGDLMNVCRRVGLAVDEAVRETVGAFVEEHTGQLRHLSRTDSLTGLYNHRTFYERLDEELMRAERYRAPFSIVLIDLDDFKAVNDTNGHQFGDYLLLRCAGWLRRQLRQTDVICRYGGDEFGLILPETAREDADTLAGRLPETFGEFGTREGAPASFGMSYGLASYPEDEVAAVRLVRIADERLLLNKVRIEKRTLRHPAKFIAGAIAGA
jgi:diguanylate cyclase (GGDEF)-like protein